jgi:hypothetical protein
MFSLRVIALRVNGVYGLANVILRAGSVNITAPLANDNVYAQEYKLARAVTHPSYNKPQNANDIGLVKTSTVIKFT